MGIELPIEDRQAAGQALAEALSGFAGRDVLVLALPRGGVPVAFEIARGLGAELDLLLVRKLGAPDQREFAIGAIASGGVRVLDQEVIDALGIGREMLDAITREELAELERREQAYRGRREPPRIADRVVILVDDGLATGSTMRAAIAALQRSRPARIVVAVPVGAPQTVEGLSREVDEVVCLATPEPFGAIGYWYQDFTQVSDDEVRALLQAGAVGPDGRDEA